LNIGANFAAGQLTSDFATYDEVGAVAMTLVDATFANVDAGDGSTAAEREIKSSAVNVGRFVPDHFAVEYNTPNFGSTCGGFTYVGQRFNYTTAPIITVTAQSFGGGTTLNYTGALWQITNTSLTGKAYTAAIGSLDTSGITGTDPAIADSGSGVGTLTFRTPSFFAAGTGFFFTRSTPVAPFNADISLAINVIDADGVTYPGNPARFGQATRGTGIAFNYGNFMRFGRLALRNANGSQLEPLSVLLEAQYWDYTNAPANTVLGFITNTEDICTSIADDNVAMSNFSGQLSACDTAVNGGGMLSLGRRTLLLAAPGKAKDGSVLLTVNLGNSSSGTTCTSVGRSTVSAAGASRTYLQGDWAGSAYTDNPSARAAFGTFKGPKE
jgi:MSHA biogenesis protein MshQ